MQQVNIQQVNMQQVNNAYYKDKHVRFVDDEKGSVFKFIKKFRMFLKKMIKEVTK